MWFFSDSRGCAVEEPAQARPIVNSSTLACPHRRADQHPGAFPAPELSRYRAGTHAQ